MFGSLDFLAATTGELRLACPDVPLAAGMAPKRSTRSKTEKRCHMKRAAAFEQRLDRLAAAVEQRAGEAPSSTLVAAVNRQRTFGNKHRHESSVHEP